MLIISDSIRPTIERYRVRTSVRDVHLARLRLGQTLAADDPRRIGRRIARLRANHPGAPRQERFALERIIGANDLMQVRYFERGAQVARSIGRVQIRTRSGQTVGYGTGGLIGPGLLITNHHVLSDAGEAGFSRIEFDYEEDADGTRRATLVLDLDPQTLFLTDQPLDVTVVAIRDPEGRLGGRRWNPLLEAQGKVIIGEYLSIIQHPNGELKQLALRENRLIDVLPDFIHYQTDTAPGSSGSLVFTDEWEAVALHHMGVPRVDGGGNYLMRDGTRWQDGMDDSLVDWVANEGVRVSRIVAWLKAAPLDAQQRRLIDPVFAPVGFAMEVPSRPARPEGGGPFPQLQTGTGTTARWVIPLEVSVSLGATPLLPSVAVAAAATARSVAAPPEPPPAPLPPIDEAGLKAALDEARAAQKRKYYDATGDATARTKYYKGTALGANKAANFRRLRDLLNATHKSKPAYAPARLVYPWVDLHPNRKLKSIYSGKSFSAEALIRSDFEIARRRAHFEASLSAASGMQTAELTAELDLIEKSMPYNCEHVVPQSWFAKKEPMRGDIHHLFACESGCNSFRGNTPYSEFGPDEALREACGRREGKRFEPDSGKAAVARAVLYFLLRYPGEINAVAEEYTADRIAILLQWHRSAAPSEYEKHRNAAIFDLQGNRNPLIDHPAWAAKIDFVQGLG